MSGTRKNIIFLAMLAVVALIGAVWYSSSSTPTSTNTTAQAPSEADTRAAERATEFAQVRANILANIAAIQAITLDTTILQDPAFLILEKAERQPAHQVETGRTNPFLPY